MAGTTFGPAVDNRLDPTSGTVAHHVDDIRTVIANRRSSKVGAFDGCGQDSNKPLDPVIGESARMVPRCHVNSDGQQARGLVLMISSECRLGAVDERLEHDLV